jgi:hypothetical protein
LPGLFRKSEECAKGEKKNKRGGGEEREVKRKTGSRVNSETRSKELALALAVIFNHFPAGNSAGPVAPVN